MSRSHEMAYALQEAARRLFTYDPTLFKHCGVPLTDLGRCDHRDYHSTPFAPQVGSDGRSVDFPDMEGFEQVTEEDKEYYG